MQKKATLFILLFNCLVLSSLAQDFNDPGSYSNYINTQQQNITKKYLSYNSAVAHGKSAKKVEKQRSKLLEEVQEARMNISGMPAYKGYKEYRDSAVNFLKFYYNVLNEDYSKIVNMEEIAEQSYDLMEAYLLAQDKVDEKLGLANKMMKEEHQRFADKFSMKLVDADDDLEKMAKEVGLINDYHNKIYLIFFKSYKQEMYLTEAIKKGNLSSIEQNRSALTATAKEGMDKLAAAGAFEGDNSLAATVKPLLQFYQKEAEEKVPGMVDFFLKKDKMAAMQKEIDKKGSDKTKADVDAFNKAVDEFNAAVKKFNDLNKEVNDNKNQHINDWNRSSSSFLNDHTPKYKS